MHYAVAIPIGRFAPFLETMLYIALVILCCYVDELLYYTLE